MDFRQVVFAVLTHLLAIKAIPTDWISGVRVFVTGGKLSISPNRISALLGRKTYKQASEWARAAGIHTKTEWFEHLGNMPSDLPSNSRKFYRLEWTTWGNFLGTGRPSTRDRRFRSCADARVWAKAAGITTSKQWREFPGRPSDLPVNPDVIYRSEWRGWGAFLGTGRIADQDRKFRSYSETSAWARTQGIKS